MKTCKVCGDEIQTIDGQNKCEECEYQKRNRSVKAKRKANNEAMTMLGLNKVKGSRGGNYWE